MKQNDYRGHGSGEAGWKKRIRRTFMRLAEASARWRISIWQHDNYPLDIVQHYTIKNGALRKLLKDDASARRSKSWRKCPGAAVETSAESLVPAAMVLEHILDITEPVDVIFSASGIREGYLYEKLSPNAAFLEDPLIASADRSWPAQNGRLSQATPMSCSTG